MVLNEKIQQEKLLNDFFDDDDEKMFIYNSNYRTYCIFITNKS